MDRDNATSIFESLASGVRLDVFRLLVKHAPTGLVAGEIGSMLGVPPTNLSFHLKALCQAGLLQVTQEGRYQRYRAQVDVMNALVDYLLAECCTAGGDVGSCAAPRATSCCDDEAARGARPARGSR